jgi:Domain of unknown function (DUF4422)/Methyltransferase domain
VINWKIRYSAIMQHHPELFDRMYSVIEIGCGPYGIAQFLQRPVTGVETADVSPASEHLKIIHGSITCLPFDDQEIDYVVCVDVFEHLSPDHRTQALDELLRVCRQTVIISCPCHKWAQSGEQALHDMFQRYNMPIPGWLQEHLDFGVPLITDLLYPIADSGYKFEILGNETLLQHYSGIAMDWMFPMAGDLNNKIHEKAPRTSPIGGNEWDLYYSFMFNIYKQWRSAGTVRPKIHRQSSLRQRWVQEETGPNLYAVYHTDFPTDHLGKVIPIFSGRLAQSARTGALTDRLRSGDGLPNNRWSELSAIYKIWQEGPKSAVVGFCHYRRLFDFRTGGRRSDAVPRQTDLSREELPDHREHFYDDFFLKSITKDTLVVAIPMPVQANIFEQYCEIHNTGDYLNIFNQIALSDSPLLPGMLEHFSTHMLYANDLFITSWDLFCELCDFWFGYLTQFVEKFPQRDTAEYHQRDVSFLSERIFDAWVRYRRRMQTEVIELPIFTLE